jgi:dual specificity MAP kinase phosphatase
MAEAGTAEVESAEKAWKILVRRLTEQGPWVTLQWAVGRGVPKLTGVPMQSNSEITPQIWVGPQFNARGKRSLESFGVTGDVNMRVEFDDAEHGLALEHYCHLPTVDDDCPSPEHFQKGVDFIRSVVADGGKVYIHCKGGIGRAPTMAAYFIAEGKTLDEALAVIKARRPFIYITPPQMEALRNYEQAIATHRVSG